MGGGFASARKSETRRRSRRASRTIASVRASSERNRLAACTTHRAVPALMRGPGRADAELDVATQVLFFAVDNTTDAGCTGIRHLDWPAPSQSDEPIGDAYPSHLLALRIASLRNRRPALVVPMQLDDRGFDRSGAPRRTALPSARQSTVRRRWSDQLWAPASRATVAAGRPPRAARPDCGHHRAMLDRRQCRRRRSPSSQVAHLPGASTWHQTGRPDALRKCETGVEHW
jgi:hypothetical protein